MDVKGASSISGTELQLNTGNKSNARRFQLALQDDGSFAIYTESSNFKLCVNGQYGDKAGDKEIVDRRVVKQTTCDKNKLYESQKWYFYPVEQTYDKTIVTETEYTDKGNFVSKSIDERGNETNYSYDKQKGTLQSVTNANDVATNYTYDANNNSLLSVSSSGVTNSYSYDKDRLQTIDVNGALQYKFEYDKFGRTTANKVGNRTLSKFEYNGAGLLAKQTYGNGETVDFTYDTFDRQTQKRYNGDNNQRITYSYGNNGSVAQITNYFTNSNTRFVYDLADRVVSQREYSGTAKNGGELLSYTDFKYADKTNYLTGITHFSPLGTQNIGYTYGVQKNGEMPDQVYSVSWNGAEKVKYEYDNLGRLVRKSFNGIKEFGSVYTYEDITVNNDQRTTTLVKSVETPVGKLAYTYDKLGNITSVTDGTYTTSYEYDSLNQLTRVNDEQAGKTTTYSYTNGNITECNEYPYTTSDFGEPQSTKTWSYGDSSWSDLLTNFNGESITYDEIGNPLTIGSKELSWTGRQLQSITDSNSEISYTYNGDGLRTSKTVNGETTNYYYNGSILAGQKTGDDTLVFMYDNNSDIFGVIYNDTEYYYIKNAQNDVIAIADANGTVLVKYEYDAWGKVIAVTDKDGNPINNITDENASNDIDESVGNGVLDVPSNTDEPTTVENESNASNDIDEPTTTENSQNDESTTVGVDDHIDPQTGEPTNVDETTTATDPDSPTTVNPQIAKIAHLNPILYRSYYYDKETEWYYLSSRFYNPELCRFINSDNYALPTATPTELTDKNLFAYCDNNPITRADSDGDFWTYAGLIAGGALVGGAICAAISAVAQYKDTGKINWAIVGVNFVSGAISGGVAMTGIGLTGSIIVNAALGGGTYVAEQLIKSEEIDPIDTTISVVAGAVGGAIGGKGANGKELVRTWNCAKSGILREMRRQNTKYATKQITRYTLRKTRVKSVLKFALGRFAFGTCSSTHISRRFKAF